jgi:hypothetical protein
MDADGFITGYGTKWKTALTLIRTGATIVFASNPVEYATISEIVNDTSLRAITTSGRSIPRGDYVILLHDSLTVDGLAQDVAETLRYYQGQETMYQGFVEFLKTFDWKKLEQIGNQVHTDAAAADASAKAAKASQTAAAASASNAEGSEIAARASEEAAEASENAAAASQRAAAASQTAAAASQQAAKTSETNSKASENAAAASKNAAAASQTAAKTSETNAGNSARAAAASQTAARTSETNAATSATKAAESQAAASASQKAAAGSATTAQQQADRAKAEADRAQTANPDNQLKKANNLSDVADKVLSLRNIEGFGFKRTSLGASDNLNNISGFDNVGVYYNAANANATPANNYPVAFAGVLVVYSARGNGVEQTMQYYYPYIQPELYYVRHYNKQGNSWVWSDWERYESASFLRGDLGFTTTGVLGPANANDLRKNCFFAGAGVDSQNYKLPYSGGIAIRRVNTVAQMQIDGGNGTIWTRGSVDGGTWSEWKSAAMIQSAPTFTGGSIAAEGSGKRVTIGTGSTDIYIANNKSNKYLQLKDDGTLQYDSKHIMHHNFSQPSMTFTAKAGAFLMQSDAGNVIRMQNTGSSDANANVFLTGLRSNGARQFWIGIGSSDGALTMYKDSVGSQINLKNDGHIYLATQGRNRQVEVNGSTVLVRHATGKYMRYGCDGNNAQQGNLRLWGNTSGRPDVFEFSLESGYLFYAQRNTDNSRVFNVNGSITCVSLTQTSDRDLKENIEVIQDATAAIRKMNGYTYTMKENGMPYAGVIAQEVQEALPEAISGITKYVDIPGVNKDGSQLQGEDRYLGVDYSAVTGLLVQVCRESDDRITKLENENESLRAEIESMKAVIAQMQTMFTQLAK